MKRSVGALAGTGVRPLHLRRRASRPQLERDPLGGYPARPDRPDVIRIRSAGGLPSRAERSSPSAVAPFGSGHSPPGGRRSPPKVCHPSPVFRPFENISMNNAIHFILLSFFFSLTNVQFLPC